MPDSRIPPIAYAVLLIACLCIYGVIINPTVTFAGMDFLNLNYPRVLLSKSAIWDGVLPLWNWYEWGGAPLIAALQGAVFYPVTWITWPLPLPYGLQLFVFIHMLAAGIGAALVARQCLRLAVPAAVCCGIFYMGNDFFPGRIEQFQIIAVNCLLPWLLLVLFRAWNQKGSWYTVAAIWTLTLLAGHPQYAVFNILAAMAFAVGTSLSVGQHTSSKLSLLKPLFPTAAVFGLGSLVAAAQLLPTWELSQLSERIWPYSEPTLPQLEWKHLPALLVPHYHQYLTGQTGRVFGSTEVGLYAGILALPFAIAGAIAGMRSGGHDRKLVATALTIWLVAMIFALGTNAWLSSFIFEHLPFFRQTRGAARSLNISALMLALLAARGAAALLSKRLQSGRAGAIGWGVCALIILDLSSHHLRPLTAALIPKETISIKPLIPPTRLLELAPAGHLYRFMSSDSDLYIHNSRSAVAERIVRMQPNFTSVLGLPIIDGYEEGLLPTRTRANLMRRFNRNLRSDSPDRSLLAFMGSNLMFTEFPLPEPVDGWTAQSPSFPRPDIAPSIMGMPANYRYWKSEYELKSLALDAEKLFPDANTWTEFKKAAATTFPPDQKVRLAPGNSHASHPMSSVTPSAFNAAQIPMTGTFTDKWNRLSIRLNSPSKAILLLLPPYPGWKLDQKNNDIYQLKPLSSLFYSVETLSGRLRQDPIHLSFSPFALRLGLFISLTSLALLGLGIIQSFRRCSK